MGFGTQVTLGDSRTSEMGDDDTFSCLLCDDLLLGSSSCVLDAVDEAREVELDQRIGKIGVRSRSWDIKVGILRALLKSRECRALGLSNEEGDGEEHRDDKMEDLHGCDVLGWL